jgi:hypothetical protein
LDHNDCTLICFILPLLFGLRCYFEGHSRMAGEQSGGSQVFAGML